MNKTEPLTTLFVLLFADIPVLDQWDMTKWPFLSMAKKPRKTPIEYEVAGPS